MQTGTKTLVPRLLALLATLLLGACGQDARATKKAPAADAARDPTPRTARVSPAKAVPLPPVLQNTKVTARVEPEKDVPASALEAFEEKIEEARAVLEPFAEGEEDPTQRIELIKKVYEEKLYPIDLLVSTHLHDHRDELTDETRKRMGRLMTSVSGISSVLLLPEDPAQPHRLRDFISHTLETLEEIKPLLSELEPPREPS